MNTLFFLQQIRSDSSRQYYVSVTMWHKPFVVVHTHTASGGIILFLNRTIVPLLPFNNNISRGWGVMGVDA